MRVLVTGASGFIGRHVVEQLVRDGVAVVGSSRRRPAALDHVPWREADLLQPGEGRALIQAVSPTHLIHLAWNVTPGEFWRAANNLDWAAATLDLFSAFAAAGGRGAVFAGTCAEYGWDRPRLCESDPSAPATYYGRIKDATRAAVLATGDALDIPCAWGRVFWLYGPREPAGRLVSDVSAALVRGQPAECSEGHHARDFLHVADVAGAFVAAMHAGWRGVFNIGAGEATPVREVVSQLAVLARRTDLLRLGARATAPGEAPMVVADTKRLTHGIGFQPRYSLSEGLEDTLAWWRSAAAATEQGQG